MLVYLQSIPPPSGLACYLAEGDYQKWNVNGWTKVPKEGTERSIEQKSREAFRMNFQTSVLLGNSMALYQVVVPLDSAKNLCMRRFAFSTWYSKSNVQNLTHPIHSRMTTYTLYVNKRGMYKYVIAKQQGKIQKFIVFVSWLVLPPLHHGFHLLLFAPWQCKLALLTL